MIRKYNGKDLSQIMEIWLSENIVAHEFISKEYWQYNFKYVKDIIPNSEIYVYEVENKIIAFIGLNNNYIEGIFVRKQFQLKGIGKQLINFVKNLKEELKLNVFQKNLNAINFYKNLGFKIIDESLDINTNEKEYLMNWKRYNKNI